MSFLLEKGNFHCYVRLPECIYVYVICFSCITSLFPEHVALPCPQSRTILIGHVQYPKTHCQFSSHNDWYKYPRKLINMFLYFFWLLITYLPAKALPQLRGCWGRREILCPCVSWLAEVSHVGRTWALGSFHCNVLSNTGTCNSRWF